MPLKGYVRIAITNFTSNSGRIETTNNSHALTTSPAKEGTSKLMQIICADNVVGPRESSKSTPQNVSIRTDHIMLKDIASNATNPILSNPGGRPFRATIQINFNALIQSARMVSRYVHTHTTCVRSAAGIKVSINLTRQNALTLIDHIKERGSAPNAIGLITTITRDSAIQAKRHLPRQRKWTKPLRVSRFPRISRSSTSLMQCLLWNNRRC